MAAGAVAAGWTGKIARASQLLLDQPVPGARPACGHGGLFRSAGIQDALYGQTLALQGILSGVQADHGWQRDRARDRVIVRVMVAAECAPVHLGSNFAGGLEAGQAAQNKTPGQWLAGRCRLAYFSSNYLLG